MTNLLACLRPKLGYITWSLAFYVYKLRSSWTSELLSLVFFNIIRRCISAAVAQSSPSHYTKLTNQHSWEGKPNIYTQHTLSTFVLLLLTCHSTGPGKDERFQSFCKERLICTTTDLSNRNAWDYSPFGLLYGRADSPVVKLTTLPSIFISYYSIYLFLFDSSIMAPTSRPKGKVILLPDSSAESTPVSPPTAQQAGTT